MRIHNPIFPEGSTLFIIWAEDRWGRRSLAAGTFVAVNAAWNALQEEEPAEVSLVLFLICPATAVGLLFSVPLGPF